MNDRKFNWRGASVVSIAIELSDLQCVPSGICVVSSSQKVAVNSSDKLH